MHLHFKKIDYTSIVVSQVAEGGNGIGIGGQQGPGMMEHAQVKILTRVELLPSF